MYDRRTLPISSEDMDPTTFNSLRQAAGSIGISYGVLIYAKNKERNFVKKDEKIYIINLAQLAIFIQLDKYYQV